MVDCEAVISSSSNWRLQAELIDKFCYLPGLFASDIIYQKIVPLMFQKLHNGVSNKTIYISVENGFQAMFEL